VNRSWVIVAFVAAIAATFGMVFYFRDAPARELRRDTEARGGEFFATDTIGLRERVADLVEGEIYKLELIRRFRDGARTLEIFDFGRRVMTQGGAGDVARFTGIYLGRGPESLRDATIRFAPRARAAQPIEGRFNVSADFHPTPKLETELVAQVREKLALESVRCKDRRVLLTLRWGSAAQDLDDWLRRARAIESALAETIHDVAPEAPER
jgi:hypothetical protein